MGIHGLTKLLSDEAPNCMKEVDLDSLTGRKVAVDASMAMYQFLIAVRSGGEGQSQMLTNEAGEVTSHIQGMFNRTIRMLSKGVKPCYIFDGKPPQLKGGELAKRTAKRAKAEAELKVATEADDKTDVDKFSKRLVRVTRDHNEDCKKLLSLMGVPVVTAPSEAEAQCAALAREGIVYGTATEDMDALTFQTPKLLRRMTFSGSNQPILEVDYQKLLQGLELTHEKFIDLCVLCGCDYTGSIKGIGPKKALNLVRQHGTIEEIIKHLDAKKYPLPDDWLEPSERAEKRKQARQEAKARKEARANEEAKAKGDVAQSEANIGDEDEGRALENDAKVDNATEEHAEQVAAEGVDALAKRNRETDEGPESEEEIDDTPPMYRQARGLFLKPEVQPACEYNLKWTDPDEPGLLKFLVEEKGFNADRVTSGIAKLKSARKNVSQKRMDRQVHFFSVIPNPNAGAKKPTAKGKAGAKGKAAAAKGKGKVKKR
ncbi:unnamed protein product [Scytosiphon promiscuus]